VDWGLAFIKDKKLDYLRLDTWGDNEELIDYYQQYGFTF
jgi:ribosomal protein S18 acetylase RimI-like enzyme